MVGASGDDEAFVDGLDDLSDGLLDFVWDEFAVDVVGDPERGRRGGWRLGFGTRFSLWGGASGHFCSCRWLVIGGEGAGVYFRGRERGDSRLELATRRVGGRVNSEWRGCSRVLKRKTANER